MTKKDTLIKQREKIELFEMLYDDIPRRNLIVIFSNMKLKELLYRGFKVCPSCHIMVRIDELHCRKCKIRLRHRTTKFAVDTNPPSSEPKYVIPNLFGVFIKLNNL